VLLSCFVLELAAGAYTNHGYHGLQRSKEAQEGKEARKHKVRLQVLTEAGMKVISCPLACVTV
jgi:hypothetical protein